MKKRIASLFLAVIMLISLATSVFPIHVHATGLYCENCGEWKDDSVNWCSNCYLCEDCLDGWCPDGANKMCANCGVNVLYNEDLDEETDACADCDTELIWAIIESMELMK